MSIGAGQHPAQEVTGAVDGGHAATPELAFERVATGQGCGELVLQLRHAKGLRAGR
jgi:hypothetical protein